MEHRGILKSVKLLWDVPSKAIEGTSPSGVTGSSAPSAQVQKMQVPQGASGGPGFIRGARDGETREDS